MNILRLLKLKELNGDFDRIGKSEKFFIELLKNTHSKINEFDSNVLIYNNKGYLIFSYNTNNGRYWVSNDIFRLYKIEFNFSEKDTVDMVCYMFNFLGIKVSSRRVDCTLPDQPYYKFTHRIL